jgi:hypothetical protein
MTTESDGAFFVKRYANDPVRYCREVLMYEPDDWQIEDWEATLKHQRVAVASGHGIGKTRQVASKIHWFLSTRPYPQVVVTANTETQLNTKTWRELNKINTTARNRDWFVPTATRFSLAGAESTWFAAAIPWNEKRSEAFAGTHEEHVLYLFDEASTIPDIIWEVSEGAMTTPGSKWCVYGNPTRNTGRFKECWGKFRHRWHTIKVDSRTAKMADREQIQQWIDDYGEDSDFCRVRVRGEFPRTATNQLITEGDVRACYKYVVPKDNELNATVFGVDLAREGDDQSCVAIRTGRDITNLITWRDRDSVFSTGKILELYHQYKPDVMFVDAGYIGDAVVDFIKTRIPHNKVCAVNFGSKPSDPVRFKNKRSEMWGTLADNIKAGLHIPVDDELMTDLTGVEYGYTTTEQMMLEKKSDMKKRGLASPDVGDACALTYAEVVEKVKPVANTKKKRNYGSTGWMR